MICILLKKVKDLINNSSGLEQRLLKRRFNYIGSNTEESSMKLLNECKNNILPALECFDELAVGHYYHSCLITTGIIAGQTVKYNCATKVCKKATRGKRKKVFV